MGSNLQLGLFGGAEEPSFDASFADLTRAWTDDVEADGAVDAAWIDVARGWLRGHVSLFATLASTVAWRAEERVMYDHRVAVPRLYAAIARGADVPPVIAAMRDALSQRYGEAFTRTSLAYYRDGADSVAWHGDYVARRLPRATVATVSIGAPRRFLVRRKGGGASIAFAIGEGDLLVMGGTCQRTHEHAIPKVARAGPRIAIMFRPAWG